MKLSPLEQRLSDIIRPVIEDMGYALVLARMTSDDGQNTLQILAENPQTRNLGVDDCAKLSRAVSAILDVEDPIAGHYNLEVSSPGIDRLLTRRDDFDYYNGFEVKIEIDVPIEGQKRFRGFLEGVNEQNEILLETDQGKVALSLDSVHKAKLVMTDALIEKSKKLQKTQPEDQKEDVN